jgi:hypothetical protein
MPSDTKLKSAVKLRGASIHEAMALFDRLGLSTDFDLRDEDGVRKFLDRIEALVREGKARTTLLHGRRVESMFRFVAASLRQCVLIKDEDAGEVFVSSDSDEQVMPSDYMLVLRTGDRILVEVKNHHDVDPWRIRTRDLRALERYANLAGHPLYIAIFWSPLRLWTLVPARVLTVLGDKASVDLSTAARATHMSALLGDFILATKYPLTLRIRADPTRPHAIRPDGHGELTIAAVEVLCAGRLIEADLELTIAWLCMFHGSWDTSGWHLERTGDQIDYLDLEFSPERVDEQSGPMEMHAFMSTMISRQYDGMTLQDEQVTRLRADGVPDRLGIEIPDDFEGQVLKLWRLNIAPNKSSS